MKLYVLWRGGMYDEGDEILGIFSSRDKAAQFLDKPNFDLSITRYELDDENPDNSVDVTTEEK